MISIETLRNDAKDILMAGVKACNARDAVRRNLQLVDGELLCGNSTVLLDEYKRILVVAIGKAAADMALGAHDVLGDLVHIYFVITKYGHGKDIDRLGMRLFESGHPVPDVAGVTAATEMIHLLEETSDKDLVIFLISGGASALCTLPEDDITLEDLQETTKRLLLAGADIRELNTVRKHISRSGGGKLAGIVYPSRVVALVVSDVIGNDLDVIASGPLTPDPTTYQDALEVVDRLRVELPVSVKNYLLMGIAGGVPETPKPGSPEFENISIRVIADVFLALREAASRAEALGYESLILTSRLEGESRELGKTVGNIAVNVVKENVPHSPPVALLLGGETTVTVRGNGVGGRNQELALSAALAMQGCENVVVASMGTDGTDGPTDAAGGIVDGLTVARGKVAGLDAKQYLARNDAYNYLKATGDLIFTGPTGTNVNDLVLVLAR